MVLPNVDVILYTTTLSTNMYVRTWVGQINIESKRTLHAQISCKTTTWMKEVGDQGARLKRCELDSNDLGFCPLAEFLLAKSTGSFTTRRSVSMIQTVSENETFEN